MTPDPSPGAEDARPTPLRLFAVAGEPSGDLHGAHLLRALAARRPGLSVRGFGGRRMAAAGMTVLEDLPAQAIMGLFPVLAALPKIRSWFRTAERDLEEHRPDALLLIDYPGFNLRLAKTAKRLGIPVIYYISPQVWAWRRGRIRAIAELVDLMLVILPFEKDVYAEAGLDVVYTGHPIVEHLAAHAPAPEAVAALRAGADPVVGLFPGSRRHVVDTLAPTFLRTAAALAARPAFTSARFLVAAADAALAERIRPHLPLAADADIQIVTERPYEVMAACDLALTTSGTTTLELAALEKPMVLAYRVSPLVYAIARKLIRVPHIGLVNLIADRPLVPEHVGVRSPHRALAADLEKLRTDPTALATMRAGLASVRAALQSPGSYARAAEVVTHFLASTRSRGRPSRL